MRQGSTVLCPAEGILYLLRRADPSVMQRPVFAREVYESVLRQEGFEEAHRAQAVARLVEDTSMQPDVPSDTAPVGDGGARAEAIMEALSEEDISEDAAEALSALLLGEPVEVFEEEGFGFGLGLGLAFMALDGSSGDCTGNGFCRMDACGGS